MRHNRKIDSRRWQRSARRRKKFSFDSSWFKRALCAKNAARALLAALICYGVYLFFLSDYLNIRQINVYGTQRLNQDKVKQAVEASFGNAHFGFIPASHIVFTRTEELENTLRSAFSEIESVAISKRLPDQLSISITEKNPTLIWCRGNCFFLNEQGVAYLAAASDQEEDRRYVMIKEESSIPEEEESSPEQSEEADGAPAGQSFDPAEAEGVVLAAQAIDIMPVIAPLAPITGGEQVSDSDFIKFALDVNRRIGYNQRLTIRYYKTKGTKTRELIAFTDKNTRIYFDTTQDAEKQVSNLNFFLDRGIDKELIDGLQYIYLKNNDRVFYK